VHCQLRLGSPNRHLLSFLNHFDHNVPAQLEVHLIADNYATHKHPRVKAWLARHPRPISAAIAKAAIGSALPLA
jgi:putative transposase